MMKRFYKFALGTATVSLVMAASLQSVSVASDGPPVTAGPPSVLGLLGNGPWQVDNNTAGVNRACAASSTDASCNALVLEPDTTPGQSPFGTSGLGRAKHDGTFGSNYLALSPAQIITAYNFPTTNSTGGLPGTGKTIAIVDAYDDPSIASDLATFDTQFGIPQLASCVITPTSGPCLQKVNWQGGTTYPAYDQGWAMEISLDVEWAHAIAPGASILLVEANSNQWPDLVRSLPYASAHAQYVSMSFGGTELSGEKTYDLGFTSTSTSYFAAAGDTGLGTEWPSTSPKVISVGATTLNLTTSGTISSETGWTSGSGGCSTYETATTNQASYPTYAQVSCAGKKATPDVAADGDPNTGGYVYNSNNYYGTTGWFTVGGTSLATPIWAARAANSGVTINSAYIYGTNTINFHDITVGGNSAGCLVGLDLSTGLGSWNN